jgi:MFS family permease
LSDVPEGDGGPRFFPALRHRLFAGHVAGSTACFTALWVQRTAIGWLAWELTGSGAWLGMISFAYLIPLVIVEPIGGAVADRFDNLAMIAACQVVLATAALGLMALAGLGMLTIGMLLAVAAVQGVTEAFSQTAQLAAVPALVPRRDLTAAVATSSISFNLARFIGPALAGGLIAGLGAAAAFAAAALGFASFLAALVVIHPGVARVTRPRPGRFLGALADGIRYTATHAGIGPLMLMVVAIGASGRPVVELFPGFAQKVFQSGAMGLAALTSSIGIGAVLAGLRWSGAPASASLPRAMQLSTAGIAGAIWLFLVAPDLWLALPCLLVLGYCIASTGICVQTMINLAVGDAMRGRVLSLFGVCFRGSPALGALIMGALSDRFGLRWSVLGGSLALVLCWLWFRTRVAQLADLLEDLPGPGRS